MLWKFNHIPFIPYHIVPLLNCVCFFTFVNNIILRHGLASSFIHSFSRISFHLFYKLHLNLLIMLLSSALLIPKWNRQWDSPEPPLQCWKSKSVPQMEALESFLHWTLALGWTTIWHQRVHVKVILHEDIKFSVFGWKLCFNF